MTVKWQVTIIESERRHGRRVDDIKEFLDFDEALAFVRKFNAYNVAAFATNLKALEPTPL